MLKYERLELPEAIEKYLSMRQNDNAKSIRRSVRRKKKKGFKNRRKNCCSF